MPSSGGGRSGGTGGGRGQSPQDDDGLEAPLGRSLAETERLNRPELRAGERARRTVRRQMPAEGRAGHGRAFRVAVLVLLALIGLVGLLLGLTSG